MHPAILLSAGFLLGTVGMKVAKSEPVHKATVKMLAQGMRVKEEAQTLIDEAKADFDDLVAEASYANKQKAEQQEVKIEEMENKENENN